MCNAVLAAINYRVVANMKVTPGGAATVIGSFPHTSAEEACGLVFDTLPDIPAWPQLPRRDFLEDMNVQFSRRLPCFAIDPVNRKAGFDTSRDLAGGTGALRLVPPDDAPALADAIQEVCTSAQTRELLSKAGHGIYETRLSRKAIAEQVINALA